MSNSTLDLNQFPGVNYSTDTIKAITNYQKLINLHLFTSAEI